MPRPDPVHASASREVIVVGAIWVAAATATVGVSGWLGYGRDPQSLTFVLGFPDWVFWGVVVPWFGSLAASLTFALFIMTDEDLGEAEDIAAGDEERLLGAGDD